MHIFWKIWGIPLLLAILSLTGLITALVGDGIWDGVSWLTLAVPVVIASFYLYKRKGVSRQ